MKRLGLYGLMILAVTLAVFVFMVFFTFPYEFEARLLFWRKAEVYNALLDELEKHQDIRSVSVINGKVFAEDVDSLIYHEVEGALANKFRALMKEAGGPIHRKVENGILIDLMDAHRFDRQFGLAFVREQGELQYTECRLSMVEAESGNCSIKLNQRWVLNYEWDSAVGLEKKDSNSEN